MKFPRLAFTFATIIATAFLTLAFEAQANDGYLAVQGNYGRLDNEDDKKFHAILGGWIMGGDEEWRAGAGGYKLMSPYSSNVYGNVDLWYAGPMIFWVPNTESKEVVIHLGGQIGGGFASNSTSSKSNFFYVIEPTIILAFKLSSWSGIGVSVSYRYITNFSTTPSAIDTISHSFNAGAALILGEF